jgi:ribonuclease P protein subunit RPR2
VVRRNKGEERAIARERIAKLVTLADDAMRARRDDLAHRYAELAWALKTTYQLRQCGIEPRICRACKAFLVPGRTSRVRIAGGVRVTTCLRCGAIRRKVLTGARLRARETLR